MTKPRYTHKSPDTTRLLPVFYRAAPRRRNSMTGQFLQWKYGPPLPSCLSLRYHSCFLSIPPDIILSPPRRPLFSIIFFSPQRAPFIGALHSSRHVPTPCFHPSLCRSLNPLSFALLGPHPSRFSSRSPRAVSPRCPISTYSSPFPLFFLIHFLPAISSIQFPPPAPFVRLVQSTSPSLSTPGFLFSHLTPF